MTVVVVIVVVVLLALVVTALVRSSRGTDARPPSRSPSNPATTAASRSHSCDVCSHQVRAGDGFVLSTAAVTRSEAYWQRHFESSRPMMEMLGTGRDLDGLVTESLEHFCGDATRWIVCGGCVEYFVVDLDKARSLARTGGSPDDVGPVRPAARAATAARAWRRVTGRWPSTVRPVEEPVDACDFCAKPTYADESVASLSPPRAQGLVADGVLSAPTGSARTTAGGDTTFSGCMTCMARVSARVRPPA